MLQRTCRHIGSDFRVPNYYVVVDIAVHSETSMRHKPDISSAPIVPISEVGALRMSHNLVNFSASVYVKLDRAPSLSLLSFLGSSDHACAISPAFKPKK